MDLNQLFFRHQITLMRMAASGNPEERSCFCTKATALAAQISDLQRQLGADRSTPALAARA